MVKKYLTYAVKLVDEAILYKNLRQKEVGALSFRHEVMYDNNYNPVFFLSTGRTGTAFFTELLSYSKSVKVFHSPMSLLCNAQSELIEQGKIAYESYKIHGFENKDINQLLAQTFLSAREQLLYKTYIHDKIYMETNNRITFLAPAIKALIPNAKFVHIYRHPGEFIRSGIRRKYYESTSDHELGRLVPQKSDIYYDKWSSFDKIEKVAWLWNETNSFIDLYLNTLNSNDYMKFNFNELNSNNVKNLLTFLNINDINEQVISNSLNKPVNIQKTGSFPKYENWKDEDKSKVKTICGALSSKYGFSL